MTTFSIKDLADFSGVKQHTIRIWEQRFSFLQPQRTSTSQRTYTLEELNSFLDVALLNQNGYKISHINKMTLENKVQIISEIVEKQQKAVNELIIQMAKMDADGFENVLNDCLISWDIHETIKSVVYPFCEKVGLFQKGSNRNFEENIIVIQQSLKRKIYLAIEKVNPEIQRKKKVILFLPYGEIHELSIIYLQYLLELQGFKTLYLGHHISGASLEMISTRIKPHFIVTHCTKKKEYSDLATFVSRIPTQSLHPYFISIGNHVVSNEMNSSHYKVLPTLQEVHQFILNEN